MSAGGYERTSRSPRRRYRKASGWSSGSGSRGCPAAPARRWSRRRCPAGIFAPDFVGEVAGVDADALVDAFEEAEGARLIAPVKGDGNLAFSHELIRQSLLAELSTPNASGYTFKPPTRSSGAMPTTLRSTPQTSPTTYPEPADWPIGLGWCAT